ncbi:MAG: hypothetical protein ACOY46_02665 [Bacillota bacterium]
MKCEKTCLTMKFEFSDYLYFKLLTLVPFFTAIIGIWQNASSPLWILAYLGVITWHTNITYMLFCPHCPYYQQSKKTTKCIMIWGIPKIYKHKPGPASKAVSTLIITDILLTSVFPLYWLWQTWYLLVIYVLSVSILLVSLIKNECSRCIWFDCTKNTVPEDIRKAYLEYHKPDVAITEPSKQKIST